MGMKANILADDAVGTNSHLMQKLDVVPSEPEGKHNDCRSNRQTEWQVRQKAGVVRMSENHTQVECARQPYQPDPARVSADALVTRTDTDVLCLVLLFPTPYCVSSDLNPCVPRCRFKVVFTGVSFGPVVLEFVNLSFYQVHL